MWMSNDPGATDATRRQALKSALCIAAVAGVSGSSVAAQNPPPALRPGPARERPGQLTKGMLAFTLSHEQFPAPQLVRLGAAAEAAGFDAVATSDHFQPWQADELHSGLAWVTLGALGQKTQRVWMGTAVTCPTLRYNPAVVAEAFATLSLLSPGRIFLGMGSGEALNEEAATGTWPAWQERWERLIEATAIIRKLWTGQPLQHKGRYYTVNGKLYDPPPQPIPLLLAANGPKAMQLSGQHGDGLITDPQTWKQHKAKWESGARAAGKDPASMPVFAESFVVVGEETDARAPAKLWNFLPRAFKGYHNIPDPAEIERRAAAELPLPKVYGDWTVSPDPAVHIRAINELFASGVTTVNIHSGQADQQKVIEFYGREVLPKVRAQVQ
jgi:F420-dependent hydroxymycolic acid dehydrogenase